METKVVVICVFVGILGVLSSVLCFAAEEKKIKQSEVNFAFDRDTRILTCSYPDEDEASALAIGAGVLLLVAKIIINIVTGCFCGKSRQDISSSKRRSALICYILCWCPFLAALVMLFYSAAVNSHKIKSSCNAVKDGVFVSAGVFCLAAVVNGILCYLNLSSKDDEKTFDPVTRFN